MKIVAVKVLNLQMPGASKSFIAECEALRNICHRNLVKIITTCSTVDYRGDDFKAVVLEFMANGSLDDWLHPKTNEQSGLLNLLQRLNIAMDVALALDYLHHRTETPIIHSDLKPSNILLDNEMTAHVGDFGLARIVKKNSSTSSQHSTSSTGFKGTIEYGMANKISTHGDVYSYGILLLEMFTGKRPTDDTFTDGLSIRKYVEMASYCNRGENVIDASLLLLQEGGGPIDDDAQNMNALKSIECIASVLKIGSLCSNEVPTERMEMGDIIGELHKVRNIVLTNCNERER